ncbi:MAG TPA: hypothetical protein IAC33_02035 [Candidatus Fimousia stercorigallinarum]|nr:hypothetical protein [Candidatus Fimousia stercorigallinarum]
MDFVQYKCPCCGAALTFSPGSQKLSCKSCGNSFDPKTLQQYTEDEQATDKQDIEWNFQADSPVANRTDDGRYLCPSCGAEMEADEEKVSTICPYCDNVIVLRAASDDFKPEVIIPFQVNSDRAEQMLEQFCKGKRLLPKNFRNRSYLKNIKGYYVPYWLFDSKASAEMSFHGTKTRAWSDGDYDYVDTSFYLIRRAGTMEFYHIPVDGSTKMEDETTESIEPFDYRQLTGFDPSYLAGYETDRHDVSSDQAKKRANERLCRSAEDALYSTIHGYDTVNIRRSNLSSKKGKVTYALLPVWLFETVYHGKTYQFAINGQTGKMVGELPIDYHAFWKYLFGMTGIGTLILSVLGIIFLGGVF